MAKKLKPLTLENFFKMSGEEQARVIEREMKNLLKRLPRLKSSLQMYQEVSDELYNLTPDELTLAGETWSSAIRSGEISTPSSQRAYQRFIRQLHKYSRTSIRELALKTADERLDSWLNNIRANGSEEEIAYAEELLSKMTDSQKIGFTQSKYFLDVENWNSIDFVKETDEGEFSIQVLKLELYLQSKGVDTEKIYNKFVATDGADEDTIRKGTRKGQRKKKV